MCSRRSVSLGEGGDRPHHDRRSRDHAERRPVLHARVGDTAVLLLREIHRSRKVAPARQVTVGAIGVAPGAVHREARLLTRYFPVESDDISRRGTFGGSSRHPRARARRSWRTMRSHGPSSPAAAFYTTPLKALSNQKLRELSVTNGDESVGLLTGDSLTNQTLRSWS